MAQEQIVPLLQQIVIELHRNQMVRACPDTAPAAGARCLMISSAAILPQRNNRRGQLRDRNIQTVDPGSCHRAPIQNQGRLLRKTSRSLQQLADTHSDPHPEIARLSCRISGYCDNPCEKRFMYHHCFITK